MIKNIIIKILCIILTLVLMGTIYLSTYDITDLSVFDSSEVREAKSKAKEGIKKYLNEKYGFENIKFKKFYIDKDFVFLKPETYYTNWIYAIVKTDDKKEIMVASFNPKYFEEERSKWGEIEYYDDYQYEEVKADIENYVDKIVGENSYLKNIKYSYPGAWLNATGTAERSGVNIDNVLGEKYTGNIKQYIEDNNLDVKITAYYLNANNVDISEEEKKFINENNMRVEFFNYSSQKVLTEKLNVNKDLDDRYYAPYIIDMYQSYRFEDGLDYYRTNFKETKEKIKYTKLFSNEELLDEETFVVEQPQINLDEQIKTWLPKDEYVNGEGSIKLKEYKGKRVTDFYRTNTGYTMYFPVNLIEDYSSDKKYNICMYMPEESYNFRYSTIRDISILNDEYMYITTSSKNGLWFIAEVEEIELIPRFFGE